MSPVRLEVRDLHVGFPVSRSGLRGRPRAWVRAVDGASFTIEPGECLGLVGESGCGKSTLARTIIGLEQAESGSILLDGTEMSGLTRREWLPHRRRVQMIFQDSFGSLDPRQTVGSILTEPFEIHGLFKPRERRVRALGILDAVGLLTTDLNRYPHEFSGGQRQRLGIARALALEPELILCDEPVSSLDVSIQAQIVNLLAELRDRFGLSYLFIAHDLAVVRQLCERVAVMLLGRLVEEAPRDELFERPAHPYTVTLLDSIPRLEPPEDGTPPPRPPAGDVPSPTDPPPGCAFHPRCPRRAEVPDERCRRETPELHRIPGGDDRKLACHLPAPEAGPPPRSPEP